MNTLGRVEELSSVPTCKFMWSQVMTRGAAAAVAARTMEPVHRTPARLRRDVVPEPMLHPLVRQKLEAAAQSLANQAEG